MYLTEIIFTLCLGDSHHFIYMNRLLVFLFLITATCCVKEYSVPGMRYDDVIVIDGMLNDNHTATVKISRTFNTIQKNPEVVSGAEVYITDSDGKVLKLSEDQKDAGTYRADPAEIDVQAGKSYQLTVKENGNTYQTGQERMHAVPTIEDLSFEYANDSTGVWILATATGSDDETRYFSWEYDETWKIRTPYVSQRFINYTECYPTQKSQGVYISTTESLTANKLVDNRVYFIDFMTDRLSFRYSTLLQLQSISRDTYLYLDHVKKINLSNGSLFDPIPSSLNGNVFCNDKSVPVLGNFQVSAVSQKRMYVDYSELNPDENIYWASDYCEILLISLVDFVKKEDAISKGWVVIDTPRELRLSNHLNCFNCNASGASNISPQWWEDLPSEVK